MRARTRTTARLTALGVAAGVLAVAAPATAGTGSLEVVAGDPGLAAAVASADGSRLAFVSWIDRQVYVRDMTTGTDTLVSTRDGSAPANGVDQQNPEISRNGRYVTFLSDATNLHLGDTDTMLDVYLVDLLDGDVQLVSTTSAGTKADSPSLGPAPVSDDGTTVVFASRAANFPPETTLGSCWPTDQVCLPADLYVKDLADGSLTQLLPGPRGTVLGSNKFVDLSADGSTVAIDTLEQLTAEDTDSGGDVYLVGTASGEALLASSGVLAGNVPSISADGTRVAFQVPTATGTYQVYVRDAAAPAPVPASTTSDGTPGNDISQEAFLSGDGGFVAFSSRATNLDPADTDDGDDIYLKDLATGELRLVSQRDDGTKLGAFGGAAPVHVVPGGGVVLFSTISDNVGPDVPGLWALVRKTMAAPAPADGDGDGVVDVLQPAGTASGGFLDTSTSPATSGAVVDAGGLAVTVEDAEDPADGVLVTVGAGAAGARATVSACGATLRLSAGTSAVVTCGSVVVRTLTGSVDVVLDGGAVVVTVPAGSAARVSDTAAGAEVSDVVGTGVTATVNGTTTAIPAGSGVTPLSTRVASQLRAPVDALPVLNTVKAGRAVPLKWHLSEASGAPVLDLTSATLTVQHLECGRTTTTDAIEQTVAGASGLQDLGGGDYQLNWKTGTAWAGSCKTLRLDLGGGVVVSAAFLFTR